jgi:hypothetical protein
MVGRDAEVEESGELFPLGRFYSRKHLTVPNPMLERRRSKLGKARAYMDSQETKIRIAVKQASLSLKGNGARDK